MNFKTIFSSDLDRVILFLIYYLDITFFIMPYLLFFLLANFFYSKIFLAPQIFTLFFSLINFDL